MYAVLEMIFLRRDMRNSRKNSSLYHEHSLDEIYDRYKKIIYVTLFLTFYIIK